MNEILFFSHLFIVMLFVLISLKLGKETIITSIAMQAILANLFVIKQISWFGWEITCSDVFAIGSIFSLNLLREYFGLELAKKAIWISLFTMIFFTLMSQIHLFYLPSAFDTTHSAFLQILTPIPRLLFASLATFMIIQQLDIRLFGFLKKHLSIPFWVRNAVCVTITQLLDTILFSFLGLFSLVACLTDIILVSYFVKIVIIALLAPLTACVKWMIPQTSRDLHDISL
ncbi:queuosine precursor transporter [Candidatus Rhabdochlamydia porcellionis]|jgi:queuosine precursor transporter|uniref:Queuosine precursor transporter n=1 Tax=Candidatus Rhabdochlamydia porcellionis TaxID=225148 RepID=A0ABX8YZ72_9BACT|nr:queuosine precursor transporter [Candidatus Rhabdochlamydia porcellionis]QZA58650.1 queuosine precursor transporter [Candidatus Rhabdochlamydia porcellionis]